MNDDDASLVDVIIIPVEGQRYDESPVSSSSIFETVSSCAISPSSRFGTQSVLHSSSEGCPKFFFL